jgi:TRAP-type mannitol/chloroaromatic compound transport system permease small subunit
MDSLLRLIDNINEQAGRWVAYLILPMIFVVMYEVILRKIFNAPTTWAFDLTTYFYAAHFMLGLGFVLLHERHVRIDVISGLFPSKMQLWLKIITFWILFVPYLVALCYGGIEFAATSWLHLEVGQNTWRPPLYIVKTIIPVAALMLAAQGYSNFIKDVRMLKGRR